MAVLKIPSLFLIILSALLLISFTPSTTILALSENMVMFTGETLPTAGRLTYNGSSTFIMQGDCNLVLYGGQRGFQSNTATNGKGCTLRLDDRGIFRIQDNTGKHIWNSVPDKPTVTGEYVAMVRPDGEVAVYGPLIWATPRKGFNAGKSLKKINMVTTDQ